jgi:hypothetical protein
MEMPWSRLILRRQLIHPSAFDYEPPVARRFFVEELRRVLDEDKVPVLSHERLSGSPHSGGHDSKELAHRLAATFPEARVLIVIREQRSIVLSTYRQFVRVGGAASLKNYISHPRGFGRVPLFEPDFFEYHKLIDCYQSLFGPDRVLALPFEVLASNPDLFVDSIVGFAGAKDPGVLPPEARNAGLSPLAVGVKRRFNLLFVRDTVNPAAPFDLRSWRGRLERAIELTDRRVPTVVRRMGNKRAKRFIGDALSGRFRESNRITASLTGIDLAAFGYDI